MDAVNWTATITWRDLPDDETICGPLGAIAYHLRQNAARISSVVLLPQHQEGS